MNVRQGIASLAAAVVGATMLSAITSPASASTGEGGTFVPVTPTLIADTRTGVGLPATGTVPAGAERTIQVTGIGGVPTTDVSAVVIDIAAESNVNTSLYAYPAEESRGLAILSVNGKEERAANTAIVRVNSSGKIKIHNNYGNTDWNVGVQGYFTKTSTDGSTGGFVPIQPERMVRTDTGVGLNVSPMKGGTQYTVQLAGKAGIPANATAVFANFRIRNAAGTTTGRGGLRVGPSNTTISTSNTSVLDYASGYDADSGLAVKLGPDGKIKVLITANTTADLIIDVQGYFTAGSEGGSFTPQDNKRIWDSRSSAGGALAPREEREIRITGAHSIPDDAGSVAMTVTALAWTGSGSLAVYNSDNPNGANGTSNVAFAGTYNDTSRQTTSIVQASYGGTITLKNLSTTGSTHVLLNTQGWFSQPDDVGTNLPSEADRVANEMREALASNTQLSAEDEALPAVTPYDTHDLVFSTAATDTRTATLPLPTGCSVQDPVALRLSCDFGPVVISPVAVTADGNTVEVAADLDNSGLRVSPQTPEFDGFVTAYLTQAKDSDLVDDIAQTLAELVGGNGPALKTQEQLDAEEDELNGDTETTEPTPDTTPNTGATPAPSPTERSTANASASRPAYVTIPGNYIYCKTHTTARCRPEGRHDYCTSSPDYAKYARGTANFKGPCARHDMGIARIATYNLSLTSKRTQRATEDRNLKSNMRQNCLYALQGYGGYLEGCYSRASTYYWAVSRTTKGWNGR